MDIDKMISHPALEQRKAETYAKRVSVKKPRAGIGKGEAGERFVNAYVRFTRAEGIQFFYDQKEAESWLACTGISFQVKPFIQKHLSIY